VALVVMLREGEDFYVARHRVVLQKIDSLKAFTLQRDTDKAVVTVTEGKSVELFKNVFVSVGARGQLGLARVAIEAPRNITILRGDVYRRGKNDADPVKPGS
jgi:sRNA-binding carbon storage regulator CsrA